MITPEEINNMQDQELKNLLIKFNYIHNLDDTSFYKISCDDYTYGAQIIKNDLAKFVYNRLANQNLLRALNTPDHLKYFKKREISNSILLQRCGLDYLLINSIAWMPSGSCPTESLVGFIEMQNIDVDKNVLNSIKGFVTDPSNKNIIRPAKSTYYSLEDEKRILKGILTYKVCNYLGAPQELCEHIQFEISCLEARQIQFDSIEEAKKWINKTIDEYFGKRIGNVGEYFYQKILEDKNLHPYHVSKDNGDGFGYDHICAFAGYEDLYETKATISNGVKDSIKITDNEYTTMLDTLNLPYSNYYVSRVFINPQDITFKKNLLLKPQNDKILIPYYPSDYIYEYDHNEGTSKVFVKK